MIPVETVWYLGDVNKIHNISSMFAKIKSRLPGNVGYASVYLSTEQSNDIKKNFIKYGKESGFSSIQFINLFSSLYLHFVSQSR